MLIPSMDADARPSTVSLRQWGTTATNTENARTQRKGKKHTEMGARRKTD